MKRRILALLLTFTLCLSALLPGPLALAEDAPVAQAIEEIPAETAPDEALPSDEPASEAELPADPQPEALEEAPAEDAPLDDPAETPEEQLPAEDAEAPEEEQPVAGSEASEEELSSPDSDVAAPEAEPEFLEDSFDSVALGSDGVQYAGVTYLSQAAFEGLDEENQEAYVDLVDQVTELLDNAIVLEDVVFATDGDGTLCYNVSLPLINRSSDIALEEIAPEATEAEESAPEATEEAAPAPDEGEAEQPAPEAAEGEAEPRQAISENMELFNSLAQPCESFEPVELPEPAASGADGLELAQLNTLFWNSKNIFYEQLSKKEKSLYDAAYKSMVKNGKTSFTKTVSGRLQLIEPANALNALMDTYPASFDFTRGLSKINIHTVYYSSGKTEATTSLSKSKYYSKSLESQAQALVDSLVKSAYADAQSRYPNNVTYGIVRYFDEWLCNHNYYDTERGVVEGKTNSASAVAKMQTEAYYYCHSSYGALLKGYAVCESYALAMCRLLDAAGIPNLYATGQADNGKEIGGHAWNYVQMINGKFYLQDSTWNDTASTKRYLLGADDGDHFPDGANYGGIESTSGQKYYALEYSFPAISSTAYSTSAAESLQLNKTSLYLAKGKSATLKLSSADNSYYDKFKQSWSTSSKSVATVSNGKVSAKAPGRATVALSIAGKTLNCNVYVYEFTGLGFKDNKDKSSYKMTYSGSLNRSMSLNISVKQKSYDASAQSIRSAMNLDSPKASVDKKGKSVVDNVSAALSGNTIVLSCIPRKVGNATITVKFAGKSAKLTLQVRQALQSGWFYLADKTSETYSGKSIKPTVKTYSSAPEGLKKNRDYSVSYENVTNAWGTHKVIIKGKGNYSGTIEKTFTIRQASINPDKVKITNAKAQTYNGAALTAKPTIKLGKKTLKAGVDYEIRYNGSTSAPSAAGSYTLSFVGKNYSGTFSDGKAHNFEIKPVALSKLKITMKTSVKANGSRVSASSLNLKLKSGKKEISTSNYDVSFQDSKHNAISAPYESGTYYAVVTPRGSNIDPGKAKTLTKKFTIKK